MTVNQEMLLTRIEKFSNEVTQCYEVALCLEIKIQNEYFTKTTEYLKKLKGIIESKAIPSNYIGQIAKDVSALMSYFPNRGLSISDINDKVKFNLSHTYETISNAIREFTIAINSANFNIDLFEKFNFFKDNIVAIGANGSGKTSLANKIKQCVNLNGIVISAQRILLIPTFNTIEAPHFTSQNLQTTQKKEKTTKSAQTTQDLQNEFSIILRNLIAEDIATANKFKNEAKQARLTNAETTMPPTSRLDKTFEIWNFLMEHKTMSLDNGINVVLKDVSSFYPIGNMSDGEKVMLYHVAQVLQAPRDGFIIVDEPEIHLHKTVLNKLWDTLEAERKDCIFIYLTHDLDFAISRIAKKFWIREYTHPDNWQIEEVPQNEIPEALVMELIGSRMPILFCEGEKGGLDDKVYNILFPNYTISPVGSCQSVINYTRTFNNIGHTYVKAIGIVDADHHDAAYLLNLEKDDVFSLSAVEPENLFFDRDFLNAFSKHMFADENVVDRIVEDVITNLDKEKEMQAAHYTTSKLNFHFNFSHVKKGNNVSEVHQRLEDFKMGIDIDKWYEDKLKTIITIVDNKDYTACLSTYNNKGLKRIANAHFKIQDYTDKAIKFLQSNTSIHDVLIKYFPPQISRGRQ